MTTLQEVERATQSYAQAHDKLAALVIELNDELTRAKRSKLSDIKRAVKNAAEKHDALLAMIKDNRELFVKPKTRVLHGVKVGYLKQPGAIEITDEAATLARIKKMFDEDSATVALLIKTTETPVKAALADLSGDQLKKLGVKVTSDTDKAVIKPVDSDVDKIVETLLKGATEES